MKTIQLCFRNFLHPADLQITLNGPLHWSSAWRLSIWLITAAQLVLGQSVTMVLVLTLPLQFTQTVIGCVLCPVEQSPVHGFICVQSISQRGKPELRNAADHVPQSHRWNKQSYTIQIHWSNHTLHNPHFFINKQLVIVLKEKEERNYLIFSSLEHFFL